MTTTDLSEYGYREMDMLADLLKVYAEGGCEFLNDNVQAMFNQNSGHVFLTDEECNVAMLNDDGELEQFVNCVDCGKEDFKSELPLDDEGNCKECKDK